MAGPSYDVYIYLSMCPSVILVSYIIYFLQVCIGVRFLASGSMYRDIGVSHHVVASSVCRLVRKTIDLLLSIIEDHMSFPTTR